jgi:hypothetical protein
MIYNVGHVLPVFMQEHKGFLLSPGEIDQAEPGETVLSCKYAYSVQIQYKFGANSVHVLYEFNTNSVHILYKFNT